LALAARAAGTIVRARQQTEHAVKAVDGARNSIDGRGMLSRSSTAAGVILTAAIAACGTAAPPSPAPVPAPTAPPAAATAAAPAVDDARGARLYDNWRAEKGLGDTFKPDSSKTAEIDGQGGPQGNGSLVDSAGKPLANTGHDYRLKNLFGWDLRGTEGVYGPAYQKKSYVLPHNLLSDTRAPEELRNWLAKGSDSVPAYSAVLDERDLSDLVAFLDKTRKGELAGPAAIFQLDPGAPKGFVLKPGGDAKRGTARFARTCAGCHGADGRKIVIDETESVGSLARSSGYEVWFKILHGQPGTQMGRQISERTAPEQASAILDLFAALCDRKTFPANPTAEDVKDADARCGAYLR
jgi:mono/diheme cytochrome c family protein